MKTYTVYGGCIIREMFNYLDDKEYVPELTITQNPISTMYKPPIDIPFEDFTVGSHFFRRALYDDANKLTLGKMETSSTDYLLMDLTSDRADIQLLGLPDGGMTAVQKTWISVDNYNLIFRKEKYKDVDKGFIHAMEFGTGFMSGYMDDIERFCKFIDEKWGQDRIILVDIRPSKQYISKDKRIVTFDTNMWLQNIPEYATSLLGKLFSIVRKLLPNCHVVPFPRVMLSDENNRLGLMTFHYVDTYYKYLAMALEVIAKGYPRDVERDMIYSLCDFATYNINLMREKMK